MKNVKPALLFYLMIASLFPIFARDVAISVQDADLGIAIEGAVVHWNGNEYVCDEEGGLILPVPDDRPVELVVTYPGYENLWLTVQPGQNSLVAALRLSGLMENEELVIEAQDGGESKSIPGRGVVIAGEDLARTAEMGLVEDVMTAIKLLPGVGYTGFFDAMPSIRGGEPGDLTAVLDGFYIENPYHWGGAYSIFDPRMTESARLSHGVFSTRYGSTISGLLEISAKKSAPPKTTWGLGLSTNAADFSVATPLGKPQGDDAATAAKGSIIFMGKVTWWQPFIELAHLFMPISRSVKQAPWIASGAVSANYRFSPSLEWQTSGFYGGDGIGFSYENEVDRTVLQNTSTVSHFFNNQIGFLNTGLTINPLNTVVIKASVGAGLNIINGDIRQKDNLRLYPKEEAEHPLPVVLEEIHERSDKTFHVQSRVDVDWELGGGFLVAAGAHERYSFWSFNQQDTFNQQITIDNIGESEIINAHNHGFATAAYTLGEYTAPSKRFAAELGLRLDHFALQGEDFSVQTAPVLNPRLNLDFTLLENSGSLDSLNLTVGTGLFSAIDSSLRYLQKEDGVSDFALLPNRSWTSLLGTSMEFSQGFLFSVEGYYKYVFQRTYATTSSYEFDGIGYIWGVEVLAQKKESTYWDGWISYSFNFARYHDPNNTDVVEKPEWYYPAFHRFHTFNLVLNIKPSRTFHIAAHLGFTSGKPARELGPVEKWNELLGNIDIYHREESYSDSKRTPFSLPLDLKFTWYLAHTEIYFGIENTLALLLPSQRSTRINPYTGEEEESGGMAVMSELSMPLPSFGVKWKF